MSAEAATGTDRMPRDELLGRELNVTRVIRETRDAVSIEFESGSDLDYRPGQFLTVRIPIGASGVRAVGRCYSLSSCPDVDASPKVTVKRVAGGLGSNWLCDNVTAGSTLRVLPPAGTFTLEPDGAAHLFFAAGSGITPVISMLKAALYRTRAPIFLLYANRDRESVIFRQELVDLAAEFAGRLTTVDWLDSDRGIVSTDAVRAALPPLRGGEVAYLCGPQPFTAVVEQSLVACGLRASQIRREEFVSIAGDPFRLDAPAADGDEADAADAAVVVDLDGDVETVTCASNMPLLDAMLAAGMDPPYSCREGTCGSCLALLKAGEIEHKSSLALSPDDAAAGYVLPCQAYPRSPEIVIEF